MAEEDKWKKMFEQQFMGIQMASRGKSAEERDRVPEKACGKCVHFLETPYFTSGNGNCDILKWGSDITKKRPVYVLEGERAMQTFITMDASKCKYYEERGFIDTDATETADPRYRRMMRQMKKALDKDKK